MGQRDWRFCGKCSTMFYDGDPAGKGFCPADGHNHLANGYMFDLPHDVAENDHAQGGWRFCQRCFAMFFDGFPTKGACDAGPGGHSAQGFVFVLPHDIAGTATAQTSWRFCGKCSVMFYDGFDSKGICAGGVGGHNAEGFMFVLPHDPDDVRTFDTGPVTSNLPLGGSAHLVINRTGTFTFTTHAHDSGFDNIDYSFAVALLSPQGVGYTFAHQGSVEGTSAGLPFGTPRRGDDQTSAGSNPSIAAEFDKLADATLIGQLAGTDTLIGGIKQLVTETLKSAADKLGDAAANAAILELV